MDEAKSARVRRLGWGTGVWGVARLGGGARHGLRRAPCIRSPSPSQRGSRGFTQTGS